MPNPVPDYPERLAAAFDQASRAATLRLAGVLESARSSKSHVFLCGNGGSAANANHWANDLLYGAGKGGRGGLRAHSLSANSSVVMCLGNDLGYEHVFSAQLRILGSSGDVLIALSGSGNSPNILRAIETANELGMETWAVVGFDGGAALRLAGNAIHFPIHDMQIAEDLQMAACHMATQILAG